MRLEAMWKKGLYLMISLQDMHECAADIFVFITVIKGLDCLLGACSSHGTHGRFGIIFRNALICVCKSETAARNSKK